MTHPMVAAARTYLGTPFRHRGRSPRAVDCAGLLILAFADCGRTIIDVPAYGREPHQDGLREAVQLNMGEPVTDELQPGDIVLMRFVREPHHLALIGDYIHGGLSLIHAYGDVGKVVEHRLDDVWRSRILEAYRP